MTELGQTTDGPSGNEATIAAMAEVLAAIGNGGGIMEWADADAVPADEVAEPVGHGPIRFMERAGPVLPDMTPMAEADIFAALDAAS